MGVRQSQEDPGCALPALTLYQEAGRKLSRALHKDCRLRSLRWGWRVHSHPTHSPASTSLAQRVGIKQDPLGDEQRDRLQKLGGGQRKGIGTPASTGEVTDMTLLRRLGIKHLEGSRDPGKH